MKPYRLTLIALAVLAGAALAACTGALPAETQSVNLGNTKPDQTEMEFTGAVDSIGSNAWSIGGLVVGVTASTEVQGDPAPGDLVRVHALVLDGSTLVASEIQFADETPSAEPTPEPTLPAGEEIEFFGSVVTIGADTWQVGDQSVGITSSTEIKGTIAVGDPVKVHAQVQPDLSLTAKEIEPATEQDVVASEDISGGLEEGQDLEVKGTVESIVGDTWTVAGVAFLVTPDTEIDEGVKVGDSVEIRGVWSPEGVLTATSIHLEDSSGEDSSGEDNGSIDDSSDDGADDHGGDTQDGHDQSDDGGSGGSDSSGSGSDHGGGSD